MQKSKREYEMDKTGRDFNALWSQLSPIIINNLKQSFPEDDELLDILPGMFELLSKVRLTRDAATQKLGLDFLVEAERDINSCTVLYKKKIYAHSVYHFQQAVEKATKGYMLGFSLLSIQELKTHDTPELFLAALFEKTGIESWAKQLTNKALTTKIENAREAITKPDKRQEIALTSYENIMAHLSLIDAFVKKGEPLLNELFRQLPTIVGVESPPPKILQGISTLVALFVLAVSSFPHIEYTRYPDKEMVPSEYDASLGIVRAIPVITKYLRSEIEKLRVLMVVDKTNGMTK